MEASPAYCTAAGKAALAWQPDSVLNRLIRLGLPAYTPQTITDPAALRAELAAIRKRGYAVDDEELSPGIRCIGAPIRNMAGRVFASISVSGPARRLTRAKNQAMARLVIHHADAISARLGYRPAAETNPPAARRRRAPAGLQPAD
jgi:DNA-binding IclR family transcriptional regulator